MKKTCLIVLVLMLAMTVLCAACGGSNEPAPAESENAPEATELPTVTAPPAGAGSGEDIVGAEDNAAPDQMTAEEARESWPEARKKVEDELVGASLEELYEAIGKPSKTSYGTSCYMEGAEDGVLFYDGFYVSTTRFPDGTEFITGTDSLN